MSKIVALSRLIEVKETGQLDAFLILFSSFHWHANHVNYGRGNIISYRLNMISNDRLELELESPGTDPRRTTTRQRMYMAKI